MADDQTKRSRAGTAVRQPTPGATAAQIAGMHKAIWDASEGDFDASDDECVQILEAARWLIRPSSEPATPADTQPDRPCADLSSDQDSRPDGVPPAP
jgi:hypothetical protein